MSAKRHLLIAALVVTTGAANAQSTCPTRADLAQGITLTRQDPFYSNVMTLTDGILAEARLMSEDGQQQAVSTVYAHALAVSGRVSSGGMLGLLYEGDTGELDRIDTLGRWSSNVILTTDGEPTTRGRYEARFMALIRFPIGDCEFETWQVRTALDLDDSAPILQDLYFAPSLGITLGTISLDAQGNAVSGVLFDQIASR